jgi:hypothetical protein
VQRGEIPRTNDGSRNNLIVSYQPRHGPDRCFRYHPERCYRAAASRNTRESWPDVVYAWGSIMRASVYIHDPPGPNHNNNAIDSHKKCLPHVTSHHITSQHPTNIINHYLPKSVSQPSSQPISSQLPQRQLTPRIKKETKNQKDKSIAGARAFFTRKHRVYDFVIYCLLRYSILLSPNSHRHPRSPIAKPTP